ncbi:MAG: MBL fold metallo-hydrolase [Bacteroidota bacterium]
MVNKVAENVLHIPLMPRNSINCYIIEGTLVDAGIRNSYKKLRKIVSANPIHTHVLTHAHADHQGSSQAICDEFSVPLICHEKEVPRAETGLATQDYPSSKSIISRLQQKYWAGKGHKVEKIVKENERIGNFSVIETPGHSSGHISLFREKDGVLIIGDAAVNMNLLTTVEGLHLPPAMFTSDQELNIQSLQKLADLNPKIICFGHGSVLINKKKKFERFVSKVQYPY